MLQGFNWHKLPTLASWKIYGQFDFDSWRSATLFGVLRNKWMLVPHLAGSGLSEAQQDLARSIIDDGDRCAVDLEHGHGVSLRSAARPAGDPTGPFPAGT